MKMPSNMIHQFSQVPAVQVERSVFDRSRCYKTMFNNGDLIPFYREEVLPGDTFQTNVTIFVRMPSALNLPIMDNLFLDTFYFFIPNRLVWDSAEGSWVRFMGEQDNPNDSVSFTVPKFTAYVPAAESLSDYLGVPPAGSTTPLGASGTLTHISLYHRAYNLIWNQFFRDENLQNSVVVDKDNGPDSITDYVLLKRGKRKDYFTSALPWTQKGTAISAPVGGSAPIVGLGKLTQNFASGSVNVYETAGSGTVNYPYSAGINDSGNDQKLYVKGTATSASYPQIFANLSAASGLSINDLRLAFQTQKMLERDARGGTRYISLLKSHFGVTSPDARLQRCEFLGGRSNPIQISSVPQTSATNSQPTPQGNLAAFALGTNMQDGFVKSFTEHGMILGLCSVRADLTYQTGLSRELRRSTRLDYFFPSLAHLGEQAVLNEEIYCQGSANPTQDAAAFGYQERYADYRYAPSMITGKLRSQYATPLDAWHLAQKFTSLPTLGATFIKENVPISRIVAVTTEPEFVMDAFISCRAVRPMPVYSIPGLIDHF